MRFLITAALTIAFALPARAADTCWLITTVAATSITGGAFTTSEFIATPGGLRPSAMTPIPPRLKILVDVVDASGGVTDISLTFTGTEAASGTQRKKGSRDGSTLTPFTRSWDPAANGKNWISVVSWKYAFGQITVTPTGHGADDTVALTLYGCTKD